MSSWICIQSYNTGGMKYDCSDNSSRQLNSSLASLSVALISSLRDNVFSFEASEQTAA